MRWGSILGRLRVLEDKLGREQKSSEFSAELNELLRQLDETMEKVRSDPDYTVQWELDIAQEVAQKLVEEGAL